ncbi:MAG TPA: metallophosphoesterase [Gemmataceae bacterium]|nr:metallophosphoesterase [Gemmataceae bacterium]
MKRLFAALCVIPIVITALLLSKSTPAGAPSKPPELQIKQEAVNPWNNLKFNNDPGTFRFAIVSDNTGGARAGVFERAIDQLNILQPEFVISVGDLIEGYTTDVNKINKEWTDMAKTIAKLQVPFFYLPGNHDVTNTVMEKQWQEKFGRLYYYFKYKDVLFLMLNSEDDPGKETKGKFGPQQVTEVKKILADNKDVRWTLVFLHTPLWHNKNAAKLRWTEIENALQGRRFTVFAGHEHKYVREIRNGSKFYTFATTGGVSSLRGVPFGEFDHIIWVTMKSDGPVLANLMMEGIFPEDVRKK